jgi:hypothetical protein
MIEGIWVDGAQKSRARLNITEDSLRLENLELGTHVEVQRHEAIKIYFGGNNNSLVFLEWTNSQGKILFYCDRTKQNLEVLKGHQRFAKQIATLNSNLKKSHVPLFVFLSLFVLGVSTIVYFRSEIFGNLATHIPFSLEKKLGDKIFAKPIAQNQKSALDDFKKLTEVFHVIHPKPTHFIFLLQLSPMPMPPSGAMFS